MAKKKKDTEDELDEVEINGTEDGSAANDIEPIDTPEPSQLDRIEAKLDQLLSFHDPVATVDRERTAHMLRHTKVPYVPPELPAGMSPNEIINHPVVRNAAANPTETDAPMENETEPAEV